MSRLPQRACAILLFLECAAPLAASLQIAPVSIQLTGAESGKVVNLRNDGDQTIHAQVRAFAWDQADDEDQLTPTRDLIASPPIAEVPAGGQQVIRVIRADHAPLQQEHAYRLLIDELPPEAATNGAAVQFRFRYSVPLFISPGGEMGTPKLQWSIVSKNGKPYLRVANSGSVHAQLSAVSLVSGTTNLAMSTGLLGYVLAGRARAWPLPDKARTLEGSATGVAATVNGTAIKDALAHGNSP